MHKPLVSVLMPVRNEERYLNEAISSIKAQTFSDWEMVVVDDASTDNTASILADAANDRRFKVIQNNSKGLVSALNMGLNACKGEFIARMDGDDISHPERLALQLELFHIKHSITLVASSFRHFPRPNIKIGMLAYEEWQNSLTSHEMIMRDIFVESPFVHPGVMYKKRAVEEIGGYRDMGWAEDYDLWLRLAHAGAVFARTEKPLIFWRDRPERATRTMDEYSADAFRKCKLHHLQNNFLQNIKGVTLAGAGQEGRAWQRVLAGAGIKVNRWVDVDPRKQGQILHGALVLPPEEIAAEKGKFLVTVGTRGARQGIRAWADGAGFVEGKDYICVT